MYKAQRPKKTSLIVKKSLEGETIEQKMRRVLDNKEPITDGAPLIYTERKDGVLPDYDPRADKFEAAVEAMGAVAKTHKAKRMDRIGQKAKEGMEKEAKTETPKPNEKGEAGGQSTQATS